MLFKFVISKKNKNKFVLNNSQIYSTTNTSTSETVKLLLPLKDVLLPPCILPYECPKAEEEELLLLQLFAISKSFPLPKSGPQPAPQYISFVLLSSLEVYLVLVSNEKIKDLHGFA